MPVARLNGTSLYYEVLRMKDMAAQLPQAQFAIIPDALNPSNLCQPETFNRLLQQFLESRATE
ncbi:alpha/beta fold hydrolase [Paenibacillus borealis]|uniref:Alpha/beta hydrolase n=1 Tax=Paenibacillus borealis TaxID=160799 RepID=A0A089LJ48_PAEBO|nr:hypothetical protein [Paenibacillus borealis]AIQ60135.1 hypothetical protein PBOR_26690 [Paenibacillus borealis]